MSAPNVTDPRAPNAPPPAGAAYSDTILAARPAQAITGMSATEAGAAADPPRSLAETIRALPVGIQGTWVGLVCIVLLIGSAAALRSLLGSNVGAAPAPAPTVTVAEVVPTATAITAPLLAPPGPTGTSGLTIGGAGAPPQGTFGALAIRDRLAGHVRLRKIGAFIDDLNRLVDIEPTAIDRADVRNMIADAAVYAMTPGQNTTEAERLFTFLTTRAGGAGPDVLFDLVTTRGGSRASKHAEELLLRDDIRAKGTPAFQVANELRVAETCKDRVKLYKRIKAEGDRRVLQFLYHMARCGRGPQDCCMANDSAYKDVVRAITLKK